MTRTDQLERAYFIESFSSQMGRGGGVLPTIDLQSLGLAVERIG